MKKYVAIFAVLAMLLFVSCGGANDGEDLSAPYALAENVALPPEANVLNIAVFEGGHGGEFWHDAIARFEAANPGVTVNIEIDRYIERIAPQIAMGYVPDFLHVQMYGGIFPLMLENRELLPLNDFFDTEVQDRPGVLHRDIIIPGKLESSRCVPFGDGIIYLAPNSAGPMGMVFNQTLFDEKGWDIPTTWDEMFAMDALLDDPATFVNIDGEYIRRHVFVYPGIHPGYMETMLWPTIASYGGLEAIERIERFEEGAWDNHYVRTAVEMLARLGTGQYLLPNTVNICHMVSQEAMMTGRALFIPNGLWILNEMDGFPREEGFVFGMAPTPAIEAGGRRFSLSHASVHAIPAAGANTELALEFLSFLYTRESIAAFSRLSQDHMAVIDAMEIGQAYFDPNIVNMMKVYEHGDFMMFNWDTIPFEAAVDPASEVFALTMTALVTGNLSVDDYIARQEEIARQVRAVAP